MVVQPTDAAVSEFNREKLDPAIKATAALRRKVEPQTPRAGEGSHDLFEEVSGRFADVGDLDQRSRPQVEDGQGPAAR